MSTLFIVKFQISIPYRYGIVTHPRKPVSLPPHPRQSITSPPPLLVSEGNTPEGGRSLSLDGIIDKRTTNNNFEIVQRLTFEIEATTKEKEDLQKQVSYMNPRVINHLNKKCQHVRIFKGFLLDRNYS